MPTHEVNLDFNKSITLIQPEIIVRVGDADSQVIQATLYDDGIPYTPTGELRIQIERRDGGLIITRPMSMVSTNVYRATLPAVACAWHGESRQAYVAEYRDGKVYATSSSFKLKILPGSTTVEAIKFFDEELQEIRDLAGEAGSQVTKNEEARQEAERTRAQAEQARKTAEESREEAESERESAESSRASSERSRESAESSRKSAERTRESQESTRQSNESDRERAESSRESAEQERSEAEQARESAESKRESYYTQLKSDVDAGEYDGATFTPSVDDLGNISWTNDRELPNPATKNITGPRGLTGDKGETGEQGPKGDTGATFTPSVAENGDLTWENDKELPNPEKVNIKGPKGDKGEKGDIGEGLKVLGVYASLDEIKQYHASGEREGDAYMGGSHYYVWSGTEWQDCGELQGAKGETGEAAAFASVTATIDGGNGEPSVEASLAGPNTAKELTLAFHDLQGAKGEVGPRGETGPQGDTGPYYTPSVDGQGELTWQGSTEDLPPIPSANVKGPKGDRGEQGPPGENATITGLASKTSPGLLRQLSGSANQVLLGTGEWGEYISGEPELDTYKTEQSQRDSKQDAEIQEAKDAAEAASKAIPRTVTSDDAGIVPAYPAEGTAYLCIDQGALGWKAIPVVTTSAAGLIPALPNDENKFLNGRGEWIEIEGGADPTELRALIAEATKIHDEAYTDDAGEHQFYSWKNTEEAISALQDAITAAQAVSDQFGETVFKQRDLTAARDALQEAIEAFESTGTQYLPDLQKFNSLMDRIEAVGESATVSEDGKDVTFGNKWITKADKETVQKAVETCQAAIGATNQQEDVDTACDTLEAAVTEYEGQVKTATADTTALDKAISDATTAKEGVVVSADGEDLESGAKYVTDQAVLNAIENAIQTANQTKSSATTQNQLDAAVQTLTQAVNDFSGAVRIVTIKDIKDASWEAIAQVSALAAENPQNYSQFLGQTKTIDLSSLQSTMAKVTVMIIGIGQDVNPRGERLGFTFQLRGGVSHLATSGSLATKPGENGWEDSFMRGTIMPRFKNAMPEELQVQLKTMKKTTYKTPDFAETVETEDDLALLSQTEVWGDNVNPNESMTQPKGEGEQYQWYAQHNTDEDRVILNHANNPHAWWLRTLYLVKMSSSQTVTYRAVSDSGGIINSGGSYQIACPCFVV